MINSLLKKLIKRNIPRWIVLVIDIYIVLNSFVLAYLIRFNFSLSFDVNAFLYQLPVIFVSSIIAFLLIGSYKGIVRHTGLRDSINVLKASSLILVFLALLVFFNEYFDFNEKFTIPKTIIVIHFLLNVILLIASRFFFKETYNYVTIGLRPNKNVLIYGAGEAGMIVNSLLRNDKKNRSRVVGFVDDDKNKYKKKINGLKVFDPRFLTEDFIVDKRVSEIIISIQTLRPARLLELADSLSKLPVKVKIVPPLKSWIDGNLNSTQIKAVQIEDLLGREPILINNPVFQKEFTHKTILITGAAGSIGSELTRQLSQFKIDKLILVDQAESFLYNLQQELINKSILNIESVIGDVRSKEKMDQLFVKYQPNIVFHAAAYKHVPFMEQFPKEAICTNVVGTKIISDLAIKHKVEKFVFISTDKAVNPTNVMGASKRIAEMYINSLNTIGVTKFITTRFGNVLGSNGSVIPLFQSQIKKGGPITVTHRDITRFFMTIPEACQLVLEAGCMGNGGEIFVFDMGKSIKIYDLALNMIRLSGLKFPSEMNIKITGLRPGEKIYEELLANGENTLATYHEKIMIAKIRKLDRDLIKIQIEDFCSLAVADDLTNDELVLKMKNIVPEFKSNNSKYQLLDT
ncbi:MAG: polysaccharide biosynthesis protein [Lutibacter sp.]|nr:polysaccharide biosynthesis protein [Lutibacter sp.]